jgi:hypothetical protein
MRLRSPIIFYLQKGMGMDASENEFGLIIKDRKPY